MQPKTLEALKASIKIWERRAKGETDDTNCPLCEIHCSRCTASYEYCNNCPVYEKTAVKFCQATPYPAWRRSQDMRGSAAAMTVAHAQHELEFLRSLLPEGER